MVRKCSILFALVGFIVFAAAFSGAQDAPGASGEALWEYISKTNPYTTWGHWPGYPGMYEGKSPHGAYLKLYANESALEAVKAGRPMPDGAIIVKENYGADQKTLQAITPMYKVNGFNPDAGDWFWAKYGPDGSVTAAGKVEGCIKCHSVKKDSDWLFTEPK